jgi:uncharacterized protein
MKTVFSDTSYYLALVNPSDQQHQAACRWTAGFSGTTVTTAWVIAELANAMCKSANKPYFLSLLRDLQSDRRVVIVPSSKELFDRGMELFSKRLDKDWSLADCISFLVMDDNKLRDAATLDHHFAQAGFNLVIPM